MPYSVNKDSLTRSSSVSKVSNKEASSGTTVISMCSDNGATLKVWEVANDKVNSLSSRLRMIYLYTRRGLEKKSRFIWFNLNSSYSL